MRKNKNIRLLAMHNFLVGFIPFSPIAILYFQKVSGSFALGMSVFAITMFSAAAFEVPTGMLSDKVGRRLTVVLGTVSMFLSFVFYAVGISYWFLVVGALLQGVGRSFYSGNNSALLYDTLKEKNMQDKYEHYLGKVSSAEHMALAISAALGAGIAYFSFTALMWLSVIPQLINVIISFGFYEPATNYEKVKSNIYSDFTGAFGQFVKNKRLMVLTMAGVVSFSIGESLHQFRSAFVEQLWPIWAIGLIGVMANVGASISFYYSGALIKKFGNKAMVISSKIVSRVVGAIAFAFPTVFSPILMSSTSLFYGVSESARSKLFQEEFTDRQRATMGSIRSLFNNLAFGVVSLGIGYAGDVLGPRNTMLYSQALLLVPIFMYLKFFHMIEKSI